MRQNSEVGRGCTSPDHGQPLSLETLKIPVVGAMGQVFPAEMGERFGDVPEVVDADRKYNLVCSDHPSTLAMHLEALWTLGKGNKGVILQVRYEALLERQAIPAEGLTRD